MRVPAPRLVAPGVCGRNAAANGRGNRLRGPRPLAAFRRAGVAAGLRLAALFGLRDLLGSWTFFSTFSTASFFAGSGMASGAITTGGGRASRAPAPLRAAACRRPRYFLLLDEIAFLHQVHAEESSEIAWHDGAHEDSEDRDMQGDDATIATGRSHGVTGGGPEGGLVPLPAISGV